jgi:hypothetical protein
MPKVDKKTVFLSISNEYFAAPIAVFWFLYKRLSRSFSTLIKKIFPLKFIYKSQKYKLHIFVLLLNFDKDFKYKM